MIISRFIVRNDIDVYERQLYLDCERYWDIDINNYEFLESKEVNYRTINDLQEAIENDEIELKISDIVRIEYDSDILNGRIQRFDNNEVRYVIKLISEARIIAISEGIEFEIQRLNNLVKTS